MGELAQAAIKHSAPWEGATPEEDDAYNQQVQLGNMEFEGEVARHGGPKIEEYVDADQARLITGIGNWEAMGTYKPLNAGPTDPKGSFKYMLKEMKEKDIEDFEPGIVNAIGASNAQADIWSHEFDHRRYDIKDLSHFLGQEKSVTLHQAFRARTSEEWNTAVRVWLAINQHKFVGQGKTYMDVENNLLGILDSWENELLNVEVNAREERGDNPEDRPDNWIFKGGDLKRDQKEALERRKPHWSLERYVEEYQDRDKQPKKPELTDEQIENMIKG